MTGDSVGQVSSAVAGAASVDDLHGLIPGKILYRIETELLSTLRSRGLDHWKKVSSRSGAKAIHERSPNSDGEIGIRGLVNRVATRLQLAAAEGLNSLVRLEPLPGIESYFLLDGFVVVASVFDPENYDWVIVMGVRVCRS